MGGLPSTLITNRCGKLTEKYYPVSLGYDRIRFLRGVRIVTILTIHYYINDVDLVKYRTLGLISMSNENGENCALPIDLLN